MICQALFWVTSVLTVYVYFGYPAVIWVLSKVRRPSSPAHEFQPPISLIIAAHNEERVIGPKLENSMALSYPSDKLDIIVVSDGSVDRTAAIVRKYQQDRVQFLDLSQNVGKSSAQNEGVKRSGGAILVFTDAEALLEPQALSRLTRWFREPAVGCVTGQVTYVNENDTGVSQAEGVYWRYELSLRESESAVGALAMASGAILAVRHNLFDSLDPDVSEDFVLPMKAALKGLKTLYEPQAKCQIRLGQVTPRAMFDTRSRTINLDTRSLFLCRAILNPLRYPLYAWGLISHKLLRWLVPYFLILLFAANLPLLRYPLYRLALGLQIAGYCAAGLGYLWQRTGSKPPRILGIPFAFCVVNAAAAVGVAQFVMGKKAGRWEPVR